MSASIDDDGSGLSGLAHHESSDEIVARYDEWASGYDGDLAAWGYTVPTSIADALDRHLVPGEGGPGTGPVLDAGCGTGLIGRALQQRGIGPIDGIDVSTNSLVRAAARDLYRSLTAIDLSAPLPLRSAMYRAVVCGGVLTYLSDTEAVLRELLRVTRPGGVVIATQRTDLWVERQCDAVLAGLIASGVCEADVGDPHSYLPGHVEYGDDILVKTITLHRRYYPAGALRLR